MRLGACRVLIFKVRALTELSGSLGAACGLVQDYFDAVWERGESLMGRYGDVPEFRGSVDSQPYEGF